MRRFIITMYQKNKFNNQIGKEYEKYIEYEKTDKKQVQIIKIDFEKIEEEYKKVTEKELKKDGIVTSMNPIYMIEYLLGIGKNCPYKFEMSLREIKENDIEGYASFNTSYITKETEKAYYIKELDKWIPKSQTKKEGNILYIKRWILG